MNKQHAKPNLRRVFLIVSCVLVVLLVLTVVLGSIFIYTPAGFFLRGTKELDLREKEISLEEFSRIQGQFPDSIILWNIPFQGTLLCNTDDTITIDQLTDGDVDLLNYMTNLKTVHGENCTDYPQLMELQRRHPEAAVLFSVPLGEELYPMDTTSLTLTGLTQQDVAFLAYLPALEQVQVSGCADYALLQQLQQQNPQWNLTYTVALAGEEYPWDCTELDITGVSGQELNAALAGLPRLEKLFLRNPEIPGAALVELRSAYPALELSWQVEIYGQTVGDDVVELDISGTKVESCEEVEALVECLPNLEKLIMSDCGIDNETMAAFRERQRPNYKVVWTVYLSDKTKARTDDLYFMPIQQGEYYFLDEDSYNLRYCEDMVCLDLGHHMIHNIDFVEFMPHLKYLILAHSGVRDVSPIVHCQELVYLEVDWSEIKDYTPIKELKSLEDLNINKTYCDITPILEMTWLKNLWAPGRSYETQRLLTEALPDTRLVLQEPTPAGQGWRNLQNYYDMRDLLGMRYML